MLLNGEDARRGAEESFLLEDGFAEVLHAIHGINRSIANPFGHLAIGEDTDKTQYCLVLA
jgi:hypothetical protein